MEAKYTKGPWHIDFDVESAGVTAPGQNAADGHQVINPCSITGPNYEANARLIAAAPELVEACRKIADWDPACGPDEPGGMSIMEAIDIARAALVKAGVSQ